MLKSFDCFGAGLEVLVIDAHGGWLPIDCGDPAFFFGVVLDHAVGNQLLLFTGIVGIVDTTSTTSHRAALSVAVPNRDACWRRLDGAGYCRRGFENRRILADL